MPHGQLNLQRPAEILLPEDNPGDVRLLEGSLAILPA
jgi:hypothetical protein